MLASGEADVLRCYVLARWRRVLLLLNCYCSVVRFSLRRLLVCLCIYTPRSPRARGNLACLLGGRKPVVDDRSRLLARPPKRRPPLSACTPAFASFFSPLFVVIVVVRSLGEALGSRHNEQQAQRRVQRLSRQRQHPPHGSLARRRESKKRLRR